MRLSDFFETTEIVQDGWFEKTMFPTATEPSSLCYATNGRYLQIVKNNPNISAVITTPDLAQQMENTRGIIVADCPQETYYELHNRLVSLGVQQLYRDHFVDPTANIAETAVIGQNVLIGKNVEISDYAVIGDYTVIGDDTYIGEYVVTSTRGLQNLHINGSRFPIKYAGGVKIGRCCEVLAGAIIQRPYHAVYTQIGDNTQISVNVVVGHGVKIGPYCMVGGSTQISGNVNIGARVWVGPAATITDGIEIGDNSQVKLGSVIVQDLPASAIVSGNFAISHKQQLRQYLKVRNGYAQF